MRKISLCFLWVFWLSVVSAAENNFLPSGDNITDCLMRQVGGGFVSLTTDSLQKQPLQLLLEEWIALEGRKNLAGRKIDWIPDTSPDTAQRDIAPRLSTTTLYKDVAAANAHWPEFVKRRPITSWYVEQYADRPQIKKLYGEHVADWTEELALRNFKKGYKSKREYLTTLSEVLLYADFLSARGDIKAKEKAVLLLSSAIFFLNCSDQYSDKDLARRVTLEMAWSMLEPSMQLKTKAVFDMFYKGLAQRPDELMRFKKWVVNHAPKGPEIDLYKKTLLLSRANTYIGLKDHVGGLFCMIAATEPQEWKAERLASIRVLLKNAFGAKRGMEEYKRFLDCILSDANRAAVSEELQRYFPAVPATKQVTSEVVGFYECCMQFRTS